MKIKKIVVRTFGGPESLAFESQELGSPASGEVTVKVLTTTVSGADINMRRGSYPMQPKPPITPGYAIIGEVVNSQQRVACLTIRGGYAEQVHLPEKFLIPVPSGISSESAVCLVLDGMTAFQMLKKSQLKSGQRIFIHGVSGAVGNALATLAKHQGLEVYGTASAGKHAELKTQGIIAYEYKNHHWIEEIQSRGGVDAVYDPLGFDSFARSESILRAGGRLIGYGFNANVLNGTSRPFLLSFLTFQCRNLLFWRNKKFMFYGINRASADFASDLRELFSLLENKSFNPRIKGVFPFDQVQEAHRAWEKNPGIGSIVLRINPDST